MRQRDLKFTFSVLTSRAQFKVVEFTLEEAISEPFRLTLQLASDNPAIAIGAGESVDDMPFYGYLCRVADWRIDWKNTRGKIFSSGDAETDQPDEELQDLYRVENELNRGLINDTILYRITGVLTTRVDNNIPSAITLQSLDERKAGLPIRFGGHY